MRRDFRGGSPPRHAVMTRSVELDIVGHDAGAPAPVGPAAGCDDRGGAFVFPPHARRVGSMAAGAAAVVAVVLTPLAPAGRDGFIVAHALAASPLLAASLAWARRAGAGGAPEYAAFWRYWSRACALGLGAAVAGVGVARLAAPARGRLRPHGGGRAVLGGGRSGGAGDLLRAAGPGRRHRRRAHGDRRPRCPGRAGADRAAAGERRPRGRRARSRCSSPSRPPGCTAPCWA